MGPSTLGGRTVAALFAFCTIIACSSFTANLAAIKVITEDGISISGIDDRKVCVNLVPRAMPVRGLSLALVRVCCLAYGHFLTL